MVRKRAGETSPSSGSSPWVVLKFGGTSVSSAVRWATIRDLVRQRQAEGFRPVVVHSALATVSNRLEELLRRSVDQQTPPTIQDLRDLHFRLASDLHVDGPVELEEYFAELEQLLAGTHLIGEVSLRSCLGPAGAWREPKPQVSP